jgi:hypothetical protein
VFFCCCCCSFLLDVSCLILSVCVGARECAWFEGSSFFFFRFLLLLLSWSLCVFSWCDNVSCLCFARLLAMSLMETDEDAVRMCILCLLVCLFRGEEFKYDVLFSSLISSFSVFAFLLKARETAVVLSSNRDALQLPVQLKAAHRGFCTCTLLSFFLLFFVVVVHVLRSDE